ncbi:sigma-54-dependent transcriptional regulator [Desulfurivibrio alkaliphilus]|uniref:Putative two component, sigma54 specific, transcriptional regulator, Fis family n=1 Tax=Desulfurivibrio alkaliphilus (strain DSM 19089 / UNIQEM U267 / AHT2) TaxID=589865 RepID=D6Z6M4_DESAT|nr:sigma-54 dependent transcriptional regulator [Desulfurivibrio alkaliphilus]ADH84983.1 putative two component, sigma54 specific, transcriptional regulator, Fis family [Desulfurivibrio alkaliphilus AHT 2]
MTSRLLIIDDEADLLAALARILPAELAELQVETASKAEAGLALIREQSIDVLLLDIRMPEVSGLDLLSEVKKIDPWVTVVMMTAYGSIETAVTAVKRGAYDFITKPFEIPDLVMVLQKALERSRLIRENMNLRQRLPEQAGFAGLIGQSPRMRKLYEGVQALARTDYSVLIRGESGTGKELVARAIHQLSKRGQRPMVTVNCPAIPENLLESELFGHKKGAFTGADKDHAGLFLEADGSTLLLDEIGDIPVSVQTKLLRALQEREIRPVGGDKPRSVDVRIISSTNQDLEAKIKAHSFREDLYYRLNVVTLHTPSLAEIPEDVPLLADYCLRVVCRELELPPKSFSVAALQEIARRPWPGNVRQLQNFVRRMVLFAPDQEIGLPEIGAVEEQSVGPAGGNGGGEGRPAIEPYLQSKDKLLERFTADYVKQLLTMTQGNVTQAADMAGLSRVALQKIIRRQKLRAEDFR